MTDPTSAASGVWGRTFALALVAFILGFLLTGPGIGQVRFLWLAYHHAGF